MVANKISAPNTTVWLTATRAAPLIVAVVESKTLVITANRLVTKVALVTQADQRRLRDFRSGKSIGWCGGGSRREDEKDDERWPLYEAL